MIITIWLDVRILVKVGVGVATWVGVGVGVWGGGWIDGKINHFFLEIIQKMICFQELLFDFNIAVFLSK